MEVTGRIKAIFDERWIKENFTIREFVLTIGVIIQFNVRGKYGAPPVDANYNHLPYNSLEVWHIGKFEAE